MKVLVLNLDFLNIYFFSCITIYILNLGPANLIFKTKNQKGLFSNWDPTKTENQNLFQIKNWLNQYQMPDPV